MVASKTFRVAWPAVASACACLLFAGSRLATHGWDAAELAEIGSRFSELDPNGTEGYDGQFTYTIAAIADPRAAGKHLDVPAYRYQRILYPLAARALALGSVDAIPWALLGIGVLAAAIATAAVAWWMLDHGEWEGYALGLGLWAGIVASAGLFLHEAAAYALAAVGWLALRRHLDRTGAVLLGLALFAKEATFPFWIAAFFVEGPGRMETARRRLWLAGVGIAFALWQGWLWKTFGEVGIGSGGAMSTPFEVIPLFGFVRIGLASPQALALFAVIFGPMILLPAVWGGILSLRSLKMADVRPEAVALLLNAAIILFVPFSTAREPLGLVRLATGLILAALLFAGFLGMRRALTYSLAWAAMLTLLVRR